MNGIAATVVVLLLSIIGSAASAAERIETIRSVADLSSFSQTYYMDPRPDLIESALHFVDDSGLAKSSGAQGQIAMSFSCILHRSELRNRPWQKLVRVLHEPARTILTLAAMTAPSDLLAQMKDSPSRNDMNWACFFGSGDEIYLTNIISTLGYLNERGDLNLFLTGATASWSLSSNARLHPRVKTALQTVVAHNGPLAGFAMDILRKTPEEVKSEFSAVVKAQHAKGIW